MKLAELYTYAKKRRSRSVKHTAAHVSRKIGIKRKRKNQFEAIKYEKKRKDVVNKISHTNSDILDAWIRYA